MADRRADELVAAGAVADTDIFYIEQDPTGTKAPRKITAAALATALLGSGGAAGVVHIAGTETVTGQKTFNLRPITSEQAVFNGIPVDGVTDASTALAALDATPNDLRVLVIKSGQTVYLNADVTLVNIDLDIRRGGMVKMGGTHTLTTKAIKAGAYRIFDLSGGGHVVFGGWQIQPYAEWFGATPDGVVGISGRAFNDGIYAIKHGTVGVGSLFSTPAAEGQEFMIEETIVRLSGVNLPGDAIGSSNMKMAPGTNLLAIIIGQNFLTLTHGTSWTGALTKSSFNRWTLDGNKDNQTALPLITSAPQNLPFGGANPTTIDVDHLEYIIDIPLGGGVHGAFLQTLSGPTYFTYTGKTAASGAGSLTGCAGGVGRTVTGDNIFTHGFGMLTFSYDTYEGHFITRNCRAAGWWTEGGSGVIDASPPTPLASNSNEPTSRFGWIKSHDNDWWGIIDRGPTDATFDSCECFRNGAKYGGYTNGGFATAKLATWHNWGWPQKISFELHAFVDASNMVAEVNSQTASRGLVAFCPVNWEGSFFASTPGVGGLIAVELNSATQCKGAVIKGRVKDCINGAVKYSAEAGPNYVELYVDDATGTAVVVGTPVAGSIFNVIPIGASTFKHFTNMPGNWVDKSSGYPYTFLTGVEGGRFSGTGVVNGAAVPQPNRIYWVCNVGTGIITFTPTSGLVGAGASYQVNAGQRVGFVFDGTNYIAI